MEGPRYRLIDRLGQGGMATVWRGEDRALGRDVAVKVLLPSFADRPEAEERFEREARALATVRHPNVLEVYDFVHGDAEEPSRLVLELLSGPSLQRFVVDAGAMLPEVAALVGAEIGAGLVAVHARGIVHRDVKPENVLLDDGRVVLTDFGVARVAVADRSALTQTGAILGSPAYMSPEQARGEEVDARSDQFSLGSVLYWLSTGAAPFSGAHPLAVMHKLERGEFMPLGARNPRVPAWLDRVVTRCLERDPAARFADMAALVDALRRGLGDDGLGDPAVELRAYFASPPTFNGEIVGRIVGARLADARASWSARRRARALASASRVLQLEPDNEEAQRYLLRRDRTRAILALVGVALVATPIGFVVRAHRHAIPQTAPLVAVPAARPAVLPVVREQRADPPAVAMPPAAKLSVAPTHRVAKHETVTPAVPEPVKVEAAPMAIPVVVPERTSARLTVRTSPWCTLVVDGATIGRTPQSVTLPLGAHQVACDNPSGSRFVRAVDLAADQTIEARLTTEAAILSRLAPGESFALDDAAPTSPNHTSAGRHRVTLYRGGISVESRWLDVPSAGCRLTSELRCDP